MPLPPTPPPPRRPSRPHSRLTGRAPPPPWARGEGEGLGEGEGVASSLATPPWGPSPTLGSFEIVRSLGRGSRGEVLEVRLLSDGSRFALKRSLRPLSGPAQRRHWLRECHAQKGAGPAPGLLPLLAAWEQSGHFHLLTPLCPAGSLGHLWRKGAQRGVANPLGGVVTFLEGVVSFAVGVASLVGGAVSTLGGAASFLRGVVSFRVGVAEPTPATPDPSLTTLATADPSLTAPATPDPFLTLPDPSLTTPATLDPSPATPATLDPSLTTPTTPDPSLTTPTTLDPSPTAPATPDPSPATPATPDPLSQSPDPFLTTLDPSLTTPTTLDPSPATPTTPDPSLTTPTTPDPSPVTPTTLDPSPAAPAGRPMAEWRLRAYLWDVLLALGHLHSRPLSHGDVKPDNVLLDASGRCRLADFGLTAGPHGLGEGRGGGGGEGGDPRYVAPEGLEGEGRPAGDIFSLALTVAELAGERRLPGEGEGWRRLRSGGGERLPPGVGEGLSPEFRALLAAMLEPEPRLRPSAAELLTWAVPRGAGRWRPLTRLVDLGLRRLEDWLEAVPALWARILGWIWGPRTPPRPPRPDPWTLRGGEEEEAEGAPERGEGSRSPSPTPDPRRTLTFDDDPEPLPHPE